MSSLRSCILTPVGVGSAQHLWKELIFRGLNIFFGVCHQTVFLFLYFFLGRNSILHTKFFHALEMWLIENSCLCFGTHAIAWDKYTIIQWSSWLHLYFHETRIPSFLQLKKTFFDFSEGFAHARKYSVLCCFQVLVLSAVQSSHGPPHFYHSTFHQKKNINK